MLLSIRTRNACDNENQTERISVSKVCTFPSSEPGGSGSGGPPPGAAWDVDMDRSDSGGGSNNWDSPSTSNRSNVLSPNAVAPSGGNHQNQASSGGHSSSTFGQQPLQGSTASAATVAPAGPAPAAQIAPSPTGAQSAISRPSQEQQGGPTGSVVQQQQQQSISGAHPPHPGTQQQQQQHQQQRTRAT